MSVGGENNLGTAVVTVRYDFDKLAEDERELQRRTDRLLRRMDSRMGPRGPSGGGGGGGGIPASMSVKVDAKGVEAAMTKAGGGIASAITGAGGTIGAAIKTSISPLIGEVRRSTLQVMARLNELSMEMASVVTATKTTAKVNKKQQQAAFETFRQERENELREGRGVAFDRIRDNRTGRRRHRERGFRSLPAYLRSLGGGFELDDVPRRAGGGSGGGIPQAGQITAQASKAASDYAKFLAQEMSDAATRTTQQLLVSDFVDPSNINKDGTISLKKGRRRKTHPLSPFLPQDVAGLRPGPSGPLLGSDILSFSGYQKFAPPGTPPKHPVRGPARHANRAGKVIIPSIQDLIDLGKRISHSTQRAHAHFTNFATKSRLATQGMASSARDFAARNPRKAGLGRMLGRGGAMAGGLGILGLLGSSGAGGGAMAMGGQLASMLPTITQITAAMGGMAGVAAGIPPVLAASGVAAIGFKRSLGLVQGALNLVKSGSLSANKIFDRLGHKADEISWAFRHLKTIASGMIRAITAPFKLAATVTGLWDLRVNSATNAMRLLSRVTRGMRFTIAMPFRIALSPVAMLIRSVKMLAATATILGPGLAFAGLAKSVFAANDLENSLARTETTFGDAAKGAKAFADEMASRFGFVKKTILDAQAGIGLLFTGTGVGKSASAGLSKDLTEVALNLSAVLSQPLEEVKGAIISSLTGETQALKRFDIVLDQTMVKQRAVQMGLAATTEEVSQQDRVLATHNLIMEKAAFAHDAVIQNMNTFSSVIREVKGRFVNFATELGRALLPAARELALLFNDLIVKLQSNGGGLQDFFAGVGSKIQDIVHFMRQMVAEWETSTELVGLLFKVVQENAGNVLKWIGGVLIKILQTAAQTAATVLGSVFKALIPVARSIWDTIGFDLLMSISKYASDAADRLWLMLTDRAELQKRRRQDIGKIIARALGGGPDKPDFSEAIAHALKDIESLKDMNLDGVIKIDDTQLKEIEDRIRKIQAAQIREGQTPQGLRHGNEGGPMADAGGDDGGGGSKDRIGDVVGAKQLADMLADRRNEKKDSKNIEVIAENSKKQTELLTQVYGGIKKSPPVPRTPVMG